MKFIKWKSFLVTSLVCLLPILLGLVLWNVLPDVMPIHFDFNNNPDNFASKAFTVFAIPVLMVLLQFFSCFVYDINAYKHGDRKKLENVTKWIIPVMSIILQSTIFGYALGIIVDIRKVVAVIVGGIFIVIGNYLPKFDYVKNYDLSVEKAKKINRFVGFETVIMGILYIISIFFKPVATLICLLLMIPYAIIAIVYSVIVAKK